MKWMEIFKTVKYELRFWIYKAGKFEGAKDLLDASID